MTDWLQTEEMPRRERQVAREEAERRAERRARRGRTLVSVGGVVLIAAVVLAVVLLMGDGGNGGSREVATSGDVTVEGMPRTAPLQPGEQVPSFTAPGLAGGTVAWDDYRGKPAVLSIWAAWCPHCQVEMPIIDRVMRDHPDIGLVTVVTAIGAQPGPTPAQYMREQGLEFPVAVDDGDGTLATGLGVTGFPTVYLVNSDGTVALQLGGEVDEQSLRTVVEQLV
ncbi:MAG TPA: TlpA disulfide reductase family protein [Actinomycetota bacterium]|nr:TlpA disulfide reductase family protein [Actinomycetota bacterium]